MKKSLQLSLIMDQPNKIFQINWFKDYNLS